MRSNVLVIIGIALLLSFVSQFVSAQIPVMANVSGQGNVQIGGLVVTGSDVGLGMQAEFTFAAGFAFLDDWYNFRWINVLTGYEITGPPACCPGAIACGVHTSIPSIGDFPAIDPAPGADPNDNTTPFNDPVPFYFTNAQHDACVATGFGNICVPGVSSRFADLRGVALPQPGGAPSIQCDATLEFSTWLVAQNITDDTAGALGETQFCLLAGFQWEHINTSAPPPATNSQLGTGSLIPNAAVNLTEVNDAIANAGGTVVPPLPQTFMGWSAVAGCTLAGCPPPNDDCPGDSLFDGLLEGYDTTFASTDGIPLLDTVCDMGPFGDEQIYNDIWYQYTATADGPVTVSTCDLANFDTRLAVYEDFGCPADPLVVVACNDDGPGCLGFTSELVFDAVAGADYLIRLGSFDSDITGTGFILVSTVANFKRGDINGDGSSNIGDAISLLDFLFTGGTCDCMDACDVNDDGAVNIADAIYKLDYLFTGGPAPPDPGPDNCGPDPTDDALECEGTPCP